MEQRKGDHDRELQDGDHEVRGEDAHDRRDRKNRDHHPKQVA